MKLHKVTNPYSNDSDEEIRFEDLMHRLEKKLYQAKRGAASIIEATLYYGLGGIYRVHFYYDKHGERKIGDVTMDELALFIDPMSQVEA